MKYILTYLFIFFSAGWFQSTAQDLRFSQFFNTPLSTNPANTGFLPSSDYRLGAHYREQWASIPVPYTTMSVYGDFQVLRNLISTGWFGVGGLIFQDMAGSGTLRSTKTYASVAYHQMLGNVSLLSAGFNMGFVGKRVNTANLRFGDMKSFGMNRIRSIGIERAKLQIFLGNMVYNLRRTVYLKGASHA